MLYINYEAREEHKVRPSFGQTLSPAMLSQLQLLFCAAGAVGIKMNIGHLNATSSWTVSSGKGRPMTKVVPW